MFLKADHAETRTPVLRDFIRQNPLGVLITAIPSPKFSLIQCSHIPWVLDATEEQNGRDQNRLRGHIARQNPQSKALVEAVQEHCTSNGYLESEVSLLFNSPIHSYVSPKFYTGTKPATGKVVPTWNYSAVQVYGRAYIYWDSRSEESSEYLQRQIQDLTNYAEDAVYSQIGGDNSSKWKVEDAPEKYVDLMKKNIVGIHITVERIEGRFKMSQDKSETDRKGVMQGFEAFQNDLGNNMAKTVEQQCAVRDARKAEASKP